ncbi:retrovirus-related pol polyprotein from transposon TNT 1-94 [Tanacetum coccineum]
MWSTNPRYKNDNQTGQVGNQSSECCWGKGNCSWSISANSLDTCFNSKEYWSLCKECRKPKRVKDSTYHKEKMLLYKQAEKGVQLQAEQSDWLADTDEEIDEQELETNITLHAKIQEVSQCIKRVKNKKVGVIKIVQLILFIVDSGCTKHMTGNITIKRVYYIEGLSHNLFSVGQFCDADLEVAFRKLTCFVRDLQGNDLLTGNRGSDLYTISLQDTTSPTPIYFMAKASSTQAWLWHRRLSHLNFDTINLLSKKDIVIGLPNLKYVKDQLCSSCELGKAKRSTFKTKTVPSLKGRLNLLHMDLCGPMRIESINRKKYILTYDHNNSELRMHDHRNEPSSSKLVPNVSPLYDEFFNEGNPSVPKSSSLCDNSPPKDTPPTVNVQTTTESITPTTTITARKTTSIFKQKFK